MRQFARPFPMARLSLEARVLYSAFLVFVLFGVGTSVWLYSDDGLGLSSDDVVVYFHGDDARPGAQRLEPPVTQSTAKDGKGVQIALPENDDDSANSADVAGVDVGAGRTMRLEKPARQVVETFHFHAFTMPVVLLIIGHIFMMCGLSTRRKIGVLLAASTSTLLHLLLPPLVRFAGLGWASLFAPSAIVMTLSWLVLIVWPLFEMWLPSNGSTAASSPESTVE